MAKAEKTKFPKSIAGFKVPKVLRKAEGLEDLLGSAAGRMLLAGALAAAAKALTKSPSSGKRGRPANGHDGTAEPLGEAAKAAAVTIASYLTAAVRGLAPAAAETGIAADETDSIEHVEIAGPPAASRGRRKPKTEIASASEE